MIWYVHWMMDLWKSFEIISYISLHFFHKMWVHVSKTNDEKYLLIESASKETSEVLFIDLSNPESKVKTIAKRRDKVLYEVEHRNGKWFISTNVGGTPNMRLMMCDAKEDCENDWVDVTDPSGVKLFDGDYLRTLDDGKFKLAIPSHIHFNSLLT